jgi:hypothetical protein
MGTSAAVSLVEAMRADARRAGAISLEQARSEALRYAWCFVVGNDEEIGYFRTEAAVKRFVQSQFTVPVSFTEEEG